MSIVTQDAIDLKKRETMLVGLKQTQGQVGVLEESLTRVQLELERVSFALQAKTGAGSQHWGRAISFFSLIDVVTVAPLVASCRFDMSHCSPGLAERDPGAHSESGGRSTAANKCSVDQLMLIRDTIPQCCVHRGVPGLGRGAGGSAQGRR